MTTPPTDHVHTLRLRDSEVTLLAQAVDALGQQLLADTEPRDWWSDDILDHAQRVIDLIGLKAQLTNTHSVFETKAAG